MNIKSYSLQSKRGSTLIVTIVLTAALATALAGIMRLSMVERRLSARAELRVEAKNTAEAVVEYGFAQMRHQFDNSTNVNANAFDPAGSGALVAPPASALGTGVDPSSLELVAGTVPPFPSSSTFIDPTNPDNEFDPLRGTNARIRSITVLGKASVIGGGMSLPITSHVSQTFVVRDSHLFGHAIFYNLDLDLHPGADMDIYGPVHTNQKLRLNSYQSLTFHDKVTTTDHLYFQYEHQAPKYYGPINFMDRNGNPQSMKVGSTFMDSTMGAGYGQPVDEDFRSFSSNRWHGNLQTKMHGVPTYNPVGFDSYEPDDPATPAYDPENSAYAIIEAPLPSSDPQYDADTEKEKMSNKAGLYFKWDTSAKTLTAFDGDGNALDVSNLEGSLWNHRGTAPTIDPHTNVKNPGMVHDRRRNGNIKTIDIHTGKLKQLIENPDTSNPALHIGGYDPATKWTGVVYLETTKPGGGIANKTAVRLVGGQLGVAGEGIPSRTGGISEEGFTFVTNNALYVQGHFNADGNTSGGDSATQYEAGEVPMAVMADSITFLSDNYTDYDMLHSGSTGSTAVTTEVSMAAVSGIRPPDKNGDNSKSGGAHNFPRFLENWGNSNTFFIRGSMVCLYECEVDDSTWSSSYYNRPSRGYGHNKLFEEGKYPPGTPLIRTYRRVDFTELTKTEYDAAKAALPW